MTATTTISSSARITALFTTGTFQRPDGSVRLQQQAPVPGVSLLRDGSNRQQHGAAADSSQPAVPIGRAVPECVRIRGSRTTSFGFDVTVAPSDIVAGVAKYNA